MPRRSRLSIPHELHQIKAQQIYKQRIAKGKNTSREGDWETARRYLTRYPKVVRAWKRNQAIAFYRRLPRSFFRRLAQSFKDLINKIWKIITFPIWLFYKLPQLFANTDTQLFALDVVKTIISAAGLIAAVIAAIGLFVNYQDALKDRELTQERLVTDRFTKAVEQLGNSQEEVVIGGIYSLERIAKDSPKDQWTIMEVLTAFVRKNSNIPPKIKELDIDNKASQIFYTVNIQVQAALTVIGRRNPDQDSTSEENLNKRKTPTSKLDLSGSKLVGANLNGANLSGANLILANLMFARLSGAELNGANLSDANLMFARLVGANLSDAELNDAELNRANLILAELNDANLSDANLYRANLYRAKNLSNAQIKSACFWDEAIYTASAWNMRAIKWVILDQLANQKRIVEIRQDKASDPKNPPDCNKWK
jgi:uncharacterized protein YjbI with pentapeptide repeats